ncbi:hypothetical protein TB2_044482 [Malus domestica]
MPRIPAMEKGGSQYTLISQDLDRKQSSATERISIPVGIREIGILKETRSQIKSEKEEGNKAPTMTTTTKKKRLNCNNGGGYEQ